MKQPVALRVTLLMFAMTFLPPPAAGADSCDDRDYGLGWEYPECDYTCEEGEFVSVAISQQEADFVKGRAECDDAIAHCTSNTGTCSDPEVFDPASQDDTATCRGKAYSSGSTDARIWCASGDGGDEAWLLLQQALLPSTDATSCDALEPTLLEVGARSIVGIRMAADPAAVLEESFGWTMEGGCYAVEPVCTTTAFVPLTDGREGYQTECWL